MWSERAFAAVMSGVLLFGAGCGKQSDVVSAKVVYVCKKTGDLFVGTPRPTPAVHPQTGEATLMPGLYDSAKKNWIAGLPLDVQQRTASQNQKNSPSRLTREGPIPEHAIPLENE